jgi:hypothetical protein
MPTHGGEGGEGPDDAVEGRAWSMARHGHGGSSKSPRAWEKKGVRGADGWGHLSQYRCAVK